MKSSKAQLVFVREAWRDGMVKWRQRRRMGKGWQELVKKIMAIEQLCIGQMMFTILLIYSRLIVIG